MTVTEQLPSQNAAILPLHRRRIAFALMATDQDQRDFPQIQEIQAAPAHDAC